MTKGPTTTQTFRYTSIFFPFVCNILKRSPSIVAVYFLSPAGTGDKKSRWRHSVVEVAVNFDASVDETSRSVLVKRAILNGPLERVVCIGL